MTDGTAEIEGSFAVHMVELQDFIRESLRQITQGIESARTELASYGVKVAPPMPAMNIRHSDHQIIGNSPKQGGGYSNVYAVEFDVAVVYTQESGSNAKIGVAVGIFGA